MDGSLSVDTECYGGCCTACLRSCAGESCCMNQYGGAGKLTVGFDTPGDMLSFGVTPGHGWVLTKGAFVAGTPNLKVKQTHMRFFLSLSLFSSWLAGLDD